MTPTRSAVLASLLLWCVAGSAAAQSPEPAVQPVPDSTLQALRGRTLAVCERSGACVVGEILGYDPLSVTMAQAQSRAIVTIPRADITGLRLAEPTAPPPSAAPAAAPSGAPAAVVAPGPTRVRHFGLQLGIAPGVMLDLEWGYFYGFAHADVVFPIASSGDLLGFSVGAGVTFSLSSHSRWKMDVFAHFDPVRFSSNEFNLGGGVGLGFHYTAANGFTFGFKVPILGYSGSPQTNYSPGLSVAYYYLGGVMGLPVISLGYRF
jgi:hypothetical protein